MKELRFNADGGVWRVAFSQNVRASFSWQAINRKEAKGGFTSASSPQRTSGSMSTLPSLKRKERRNDGNIEGDDGKLSAKEREAVEARAAELIAEEMTLRDLRNALELTQKTMAKSLGINQENLSRLERRSDLLLSTLSSYVEAMGGHLHLVAEFPDRPPVFLTGLAALENEKAKQPRRPSREPGRTKA